MLNKPLFSGVLPHLFHWCSVYLFIYFSQYSTRFFPNFMHFLKQKAYLLHSFCMCYIAFSHDHVLSFFINRFISSMIVFLSSCDNFVKSLVTSPNVSPRVYTFCNSSNGCLKVDTPNR